MIKKGKKRVRGKRASAFRRNSRRKRGNSMPSKNSLTWRTDSHVPEVAGEKEPFEKEAEKASAKASGLAPTVQMKSDGVSKNSVSSSFVKSLNATKNNGIPLPDKTLKSMSSKIGSNFKDVRIHKDKEANAMNKEINARAFTYGRDIYFKEGHFQPDTKDGQKLIAHELVHTQQQTAKIHRAPEFDAAGNPTGNYIFKSGSAISSQFWQLARNLTADGPLTADEISQLRIQAITARGSVNHAERLFMAALLEQSVVNLLQADNKGSITVPFSDISTANRRQVRNSGLENIPQDVNIALLQHLWQLMSGDTKAVADAMKNLNQASTNALLNMVGGYRYKMAAVIAYANAKKISIYDVLEAAQNGGSDHSDGDQYMAALSYTVLTAGGFAEAVRIKNGLLKIDALSDSAYNKIKGESTGSYSPVGNREDAKGDTIYLRTSFDVDNVNDRALLAHEFTHFLQDLSNASTPGSYNIIPQEIEAYQAQARYTMDEILAAKTPREKNALIHQARFALAEYVQWAYIMVTKANQARYKDTCIAVLTQLPYINELRINGALSAPHANLIALITNALVTSGHYKVGSTIHFDGNVGPSFLDHYP